MFENWQYVAKLKILRLLHVQICIIQQTLKVHKNTLLLADRSTLLNKKVIICISFEGIKSLIRK